MKKKQKILIVDDQSGILHLISHVFQKAGYEVETAQSGSEGLQKAQQIEPDLVILDVSMPDMNGFEVCRRLRTHPKTVRLPIIMLTAKNELTDKVEGFQAGADDYVIKPVAKEELLLRANALLHRSRMAQTPAAQSVALVGAKGGVGVTSVAINIGLALNTQGHNAAVIELHEAPGTAVFQVNVSPEHDLGTLLRQEPFTISTRTASQAMTHHPSGLHLLPAPQNNEIHTLTTAHALAIIEALSQGYDYLLLDLPHLAGEATYDVLQEVETILLVTEPEPLSVAAANTQLKTLKAWGMFDKMRLVVVSRSPSATLLRREEIAEALNLPVIDLIIRMVPPAPEAFQQASRQGTPIVALKPDILAAQTLNALAEWLVEHTSALVLA